MRSHSIFALLFLAYAIPGTLGCSRIQPAPIHEGLPERQPETTRQSSVLRSHAVVKGDTLYSIAWRYGLDPLDLSLWNNIASPYTIYVGDRIHLYSSVRTQAEKKMATSTPSIARKEKKTASVRKQHEEISAHKQPTESQRRITVADTSGAWQWPADGKVIKVNSPLARNGISIAGRLDQEVRAARAGEVVYSGSGLIGYGRLIIVKHDEIYMTAYARNRTLFSTTGDIVKAGQKIAAIGEGFSDQPMLYFELRRRGKPIDPLSVLPRKR